MFGLHLVYSTVAPHQDFRAPMGVVHTAHGICVCIPTSTTVEWFFVELVPGTSPKKSQVDSGDISIRYSLLYGQGYDDVIVPLITVCIVSKFQSF